MITKAYETSIKNKEKYRNGARIWWRIADIDWDQSMVSKANWYINKK